MKQEMNRILRDFIIEASEQELLEALKGTDENFMLLAIKGKVVIEKALNDVKRGRQLSTSNLPPYRDYCNFNGSK
jgi:hypothetical protein